MQRLIIDTDPGVDDAQALLMAAAHPHATIEAVTVVAGNVGLDRTLPNACTILDLLGSDAPVFAGCAHALVHGGQYATNIHGEDGLGNTHFPPSPRMVEAEHAAAALVRLATADPGAYTLVALGPLTNIALALKLDPQLPSKFARLVIMGGAVRSMGNATNLSAEFNIFSDPEAAHIVFDEWPAFELVDWEVTMDHGIPHDIVDHWLSLETERARFFRAITQQLLERVRATSGRAEMFAADPLAMAVVLEPEIVQHAEEHYATVELAGYHTRGQTTVDWRDRSDQRKNAKIVLRVDEERFYALMENALQAK